MERQSQHRPGALAKHSAGDAVGIDVKTVAGGQSLIPSLNMRLSTPQLLVDIGALARLREISLQPGGLRIGALVTHAEIERSAEVPVRRAIAVDTPPRGSPAARADSRAPWKRRGSHSPIPCTPW